MVWRGGQCRQLFILAIGRAMFNGHVPALGIAPFLEPFAEGLRLSRASQRRDRVQYSYHRQCRLLPPHYHRPRSHAPETCDELPPFH
jgi:hypothetical protein